MPAVERPGELGPPVLAVALGMTAVLLLVLASAAFLADLCLSKPAARVLSSHQASQ